MSNMMTSSLCVSGMNRARENEITDVAITANMDELRVGVCSDEKMITNINNKILITFSTHLKNRLQTSNIITHFNKKKFTILIPKTSINTTQSTPKYLIF